MFQVSSLYLIHSKVYSWFKTTEIQIRLPCIKYSLIWFNCEILRVMIILPDDHYKTIVYRLDLILKRWKLFPWSFMPKFLRRLAIYWILFIEQLLRFEQLNVEQLLGFEQFSGFKQLNIEQFIKQKIRLSSLLNIVTGFNSYRDFSKGIESSHNIFSKLDNLNLKIFTDENILYQRIFFHM